MYISVQKVYGKAKIYGYSKDVVTSITTQVTTDKTITRYYWKYSDEKFERENYSYKFCIKESYRENGKVKQRQMVLGTFFWYDFIDHWIGDDVCWDDEKFFGTFPNATESDLGSIQTEFVKKAREIETVEFDKWSCSEESKSHRRHLEQVQRYENKKRYYDSWIGEGWFEQIFDFNLNIVNEELYHKIPDIHEKKIAEDREKISQEQEERDKRNKQWEDYKKTYGSYSFGLASSYTDQEKIYLKKFYRVLAAKFHPDSTGDNEVMQFLNKLKEQWNV